MNDTINKVDELMRLIGAYAVKVAVLASGVKSTEQDVVSANLVLRAALEAALVGSAVPLLSDEQIYRVVRSTQPDLDDDTPAWGKQFNQCKYWVHAAQILSTHGMTGGTK